MGNSHKGKLSKLLFTPKPPILKFILAWTTTGETKKIQFRWKPFGKRGIIAVILSALVPEWHDTNKSKIKLKFAVTALPLQEIERGRGILSICILSRMVSEEINHLFISLYGLSSNSLLCQSFLVLLLLKALFSRDLNNWCWANRIADCR